MPNSHRRVRIQVQLPIRRRPPLVLRILRALRPSKGLKSKRIKKFQHFEAENSMVGEQCVVCLDDLKIGTKMVRLDCHVDHYLCKKCTDNWFKEHNTCPSCRKVFN